jgi:glycosyltransferase involved in cell wall biosynthesis
VRIWNIIESLKKLVPVTVIAGERAERRRAIQQHLRDGLLDHISALYVENSTSWATLADFRLMFACKRRKIPIITYIRDAYPLYPETMSHLSFFKRTISSFLWRLSMVGYVNLSDRLAFQSQSFASLFQKIPKSRKMILGPAATPVSPSPISPGANAILYTGNASQPRFGVEILVKAAEIARVDIPELRLLLVCAPDRFPPIALYKNRSWIEVSSHRFDEIPDRLGTVRVVVNPLLQAAYHHLQMPIKVMGYLAYGRPMLVTPCREIARFVEENQVGLVVEDTPESMAAGIRHLFSVDFAELSRMGQNACRIVGEKHSWDHRAQQILDVFEEIRRSPQKFAA